MRHTTVSTLALGAALLSAAAQPALAESGEGEEQPTPVKRDEDAGNDNRITVTATRTPVLVEEAPATVTIITNEDIADQLATDLRDLVRFEPGVSVRRAPARFGATFGATGRARNEDFVIRGIGGNRVLIQVDGIRSPQGFSFGPQEVGRANGTDVSLVRQVEILRGPASALYGSDGLAGAISFTTADPVDIIGADSLGGFVTSQYSSEDNEFANTATLAGQTGNLSAYIAYTRRDFQELENQGEIGGTGEARTLPNPQDGESNAVLGKLVWNNGEHRLRLTGEWLESEIATNVLTGLGPAFVFGPAPVWNVDRLEAQDTSSRTRLSADWTWQGEGADAIEYAFLTGFWQQGEDFQFAEEDRTPLGPAPAPDRIRINTFDNEVYGLAGVARSSFEAGGASVELAFGGDVSWTRQEGLRNGTVPPSGDSFPARAFPVTDFTLGGIFLAGEIALFDGMLTVFPALRFDFYDLNPTDDPLTEGFLTAGQSDQRLSPKLGLTLEPVDNVILFGNYAQGFLAPTPGQVNNFFESFGATALPNPDLGPETSESWEIGARYVGDGFSLQAVRFEGDYDDFISQQVIGGSFTPQDPALFQFVNFDGAAINGFEVKADWQSDSGITANFALAYANGDIVNPDGSRTPLDTVDPLTIVGGLGYRDPGGRFGADLIVTHNARKQADEVERGADRADLFVRPDASTILDLTAFLEVTSSLKLRAGLFNVFDETYALWSDVRGLRLEDADIFGAFTRPGRNASVSISYQF